MEKYPWL